MQDKNTAKCTLVHLEAVKTINALRKKTFSSNVALCFLNFYIHSYAHISQETLCVAGRVADPKCRHASGTEIGNRFIAGFAEHKNIRRLTGIK